MSKSNPEQSREREFKVILENIETQFRTFGEGLDNVQERLGRVESDTTQIKEDVGVIKSAFPRFVKQVSDHEKRLTKLEQTR